MKHSLVNRLNALEQKNAAREPNAIALGIRTLIDVAKAGFSTDRKTSRLQAVEALKRSPHISSLSLNLLHQLESLFDSEGEST